MAKLVSQGQQDQQGQANQQVRPANKAQGVNGQQGQQGQQVGSGQQGAVSKARRAAAEWPGWRTRAGDLVGPGGPGGARDRYGNNWIDTGDNARNGPRAPAQATPAGDPQQAIQQGLKELNQLRHELPNDPETQRQIQELITAMEHLDLKRFPGNPAMVDELHQRLLSGVTTLELQVRQNLDAKQSGQVRSADPTAVPPGYKDAVAEYFRRLSAARVQEISARPRDQRETAALPLRLRLISPLVSP